MKHLKRFLSILLCVALLLPMAAEIVAAADTIYSISDGYITVSVNSGNGGFHIATQEGNLLKKSDNNKDLLYRNGRYDTSFVSFRVGTGTSQRDYLFGGYYPDENSTAIQVSQDASGVVTAVWGVDGITFTQTIALAAEDSATHGMVSISLGASGTTEPVQARILLDTCLGTQDYGYYQVSGGTLTNTIRTESVFTDPEQVREFYVVDDIADNSIMAYTVSSQVPAKVAVAHWNNLASTLFEFTPSAGLNFTNAVNTYLTADSACAMYFDLSDGPVNMYYGVFSNHDVDLSQNVAINAVAPLRLDLNDARTDYEPLVSQGLADFSVRVDAENFASESAQTYDTVALQIQTTSNIRPLDENGNEITGVDFESVSFPTITKTDFRVRENWSPTIYFEARTLESASYERITLSIFNLDGNGELTKENLLGQKVIYVLLPGSDGNIPQVTFNQMSPSTIYSSGTRHIYVACGNSNILETALQAGICGFVAYTKDGKTSVKIPNSSITFNGDGIADLVIDTDKDGKDVVMATGSWYLQLEWTNDALTQGVVTAEYQKQTAQVLNFTVSDDPKFRNDTYGIIAAVKYGTKASSSDPLRYELKTFKDEADLEKFTKKEDPYTAETYKEILLVFRGQFTGDKRYAYRDEYGNIKWYYYYTAVSTKTVDETSRETKVDNMVTINNCLDFEGGTMTIYYEDYKLSASNVGNFTGAKNSAICVEFEGDLYTSDERSSVWTGKAAITKLEQGADFSLITYDGNGNRTNANSTASPINLIWPNIYGYAQKLAGCIFKLAYGQFGVMKNSEGEIGRVVSFSASLSLKFLRSPADSEIDQGTASYFGRMQELWKNWNGASLYQYAYNGGRYEKLTRLNPNDKDKSGEDKKGVTASVMVKDILFGCGKGFVGLNFTVDLGFKNFVEGLPEIGGTLTVNTINDWSFGINGRMELANFKLQTELSFRSKDNIPVPNNIYFFVGGFDPGLNVDGCGVLWLTGGGGGIYNIYDTIFMSSGLPPLKLVLTVSFKILQILSAKSSLELSLSGLGITATDIKFADTIPVIKKMTLGLQWYPDLKLSASIYIDMFEKTICGNGYIVLLGKEYSDWFFEMFARVRLQIPESVPAVGGMTLLGVNIGISESKIWGAVEALTFNIGITYYWGEDDFHIGSGGDFAQPSYPSMLTLQDYDGEPTGFPVLHDEENHRTLYAQVGTNFDPPQAAQVMEEDDLILMGNIGERVIQSKLDKTVHMFNLGTYDDWDNKSTMVQVNYYANSLAQAKSIAAGFTIAENQNGSGEQFPLAMTQSIPAQDDGETDEAYEARIAGVVAANGNANANVTWDPNTKLATLCLGISDETLFDQDWYIITGNPNGQPVDVIMYNVKDLPSVDGLDVDLDSYDGKPYVEVEWYGNGIDELDYINFALCETTDPQEPGYGLGKAENLVWSSYEDFDILPDLPSGDYYVRATYAKDGVVNGVYYTDTPVFHWDNTSQPADIDSLMAVPGGDLKYLVTVPATTDANTAGYLVTIYNEDGTPTVVEDLRFDKEELGATTFLVGGTYAAAVPSVADPNGAATDTIITGLTAGGNYTIGVTPFNEFDLNGDGEPDSLVRGTEKVVAAGTLPAAVTPTMTLSYGDGVLTSVQSAAADVMTVNADGTTTVTNTNDTVVFTADEVQLFATFSEDVTGCWTLDDEDGDLWELPAGMAPQSGSFSGTSAAIDLTGLADGSHQLTFTGNAADLDAFSAVYSFDVDTTAPRLMLSSPLNGSPFNADGTVTVSGISDRGAVLHCSVDGGAESTLALSPDRNGVFSCDIDVSAANGGATHTLVLYASDENGNKTAAQTITVIHPKYGDIQKFVLLVDGNAPADGSIATGNNGTAALSVAGVTSDNQLLVLDPMRVDWNVRYEEGRASVAADGTLTYTAFTKGFVEARVEVSEGAYRTANVVLNSDEERFRVDVETVGEGTAFGSQYYAAGETVSLRAVPGEGYTFDHWEIPGVTLADATQSAVSFTFPGIGDIIAKAVFRLSQYTITWTDDEDNVYDTTTVEHGTMPVHADPEKPSTAQFNYTFEKWTPDLATATGDATYKASFTSQLRSYAVTWKNYDGTVLAVTETEYGQKPAYAGTTPAKDPTPGKTYTFNGWTPEVTEVTGEAAYTAVFAENTVQHTVTWLIDGVPTAEVYDYGSTPSYKGGTPAKASTAQYDYTFTGWSPDIADVTADTTYTAVFEPVLRSYTISWLNEDGSLIDTTTVAYGETPSHADASREGDAQYSYTFEGWTPSVVPVTGNAAYTARFTQSVNSYEITWLNGDGSLIDTTHVEYGKTPSHVAPEKPADAEYTYVFAGWDPTPAAVTGPATYKATFTTDTNAYTITWKDDDGSVLGTTRVAYGAVPSFAEPSKDSTAEFDYSFAGWSPALKAVDGDATYQATYNALRRSYAVRFLNEDGTELQNTAVPYGQTPVYEGAVPVKAPVPGKTYTFAGWTPALAAVTGEATYTAVFTENTIQYTITWVVDGEETAETYTYGETPVFKGTTPEKASTDQYDYTFKGWNPDIAEVTENARYTAVFEPAVRSYTITWKNEDGSVIDTTTVVYGQTPAHEDPAKAGDAQYSYRFTGWTPALAPVTGDAEYTAKFEQSVNVYTITWLMDDGSLIDTTEVPYGTVPGHVAPEKEPDDEFTYAFAGWDPAVTAVTGPATYKAKFTDATNAYTITWQNEDGSVIDTTLVGYGAMPSHADPVKESTAEYDYVFEGWDPALTEVAGDAAYKAVFRAVKRSYTVRFLSEAGTVLETQSVEYGKTPVFGGTEPVKPSTAEFDYSFSGWTPDVAAVTGDADYTAAFTPNRRSYSIRFIAEDGSELAVQTVEYGQIPVYGGKTPTKPSTAEFDYTFAGWDPALAAVTGEATYKAAFEAATRSYTVRFLNEDGSVLESQTVSYGVTPIYGGETPAKDPVPGKTYTFKGWSPALAAVTGDADYTAVYTENAVLYTVRWIIEGEETAETYEYGAIPAYKGGTPEKPEDKDYVYVFKEWSPAIAAVEGDAAYTAVFEGIYKHGVEVRNVDVADGAITVTFFNHFLDGAVALIALYDENKRFIGLHAEALPLGEETTVFLTADQTEGAASAGVFVVDPSMKPEMAEGEIDIAEGTLLYDAVANFMNGTYTADNATMMFRKAVRLHKGDEGGMLKLYEKCGKDSVCPMAAYTDIKPTDWYHDGVHFVLENGIMGGTAESAFSPEATATRAMIVRMLWNLAGQPEAEGKADFADVAEDAWYADAVAWAAAEGIVSGYGEAFGPDDAVTREQLAAILYGYAKYRGIEKVLTMEYILGRYTDGEETSDWAKAALDWAIKLNVLGGVTPDTMKPKAEATRAQVATMLKNFCTGVLPEKE